MILRGKGWLCEEVGQSSIARTRGLLMLRGSRGRVPHLVLIWTEIGVGVIFENSWITQTCD